MKFRLEKASDWSFEKEVVVNSIDELMNLIDEYGEHSLVVHYDKKTIIIYDGYME